MSLHNLSRMDPWVFSPRTSKLSGGPAGETPRNRFRLFLGAVTEDNPSFGEIVRGHFHLHFVSGGDPNKVFAHFATDVRKDFMSVFQFHTVHGRREHLINGSVDLNEILIFLGWHKWGVVGGGTVRIFCRLANKKD